MEKLPENAIFFDCHTCDFKCSKQSNYDKHLLTLKHQNRTKLNNLEQKMPKNAESLFICKKCNKEYTARNSLWYHEKKCNIVIEAYNDNTSENKGENKGENKDELINYLIKENQEFKNLILEIVKKDNSSSIINSNNTTTNSHNKTFNLQFFLNETCKNAMNISDFVD